MKFRFLLYVFLVFLPVVSLAEAPPFIYKSGDYLCREGFSCSARVSSDGYQLSESLSPVQQVSVTPTIDTNAYAAGDLIGTKLTFASALNASSLSGLLTSVTLTDLGAEGKNVELVIFNADPTGTTFTDNAAFDPADADLTKIVCRVYITSHSAFNDNGASFANNIGCAISASTSTIYGAMIAREIVTYDTTSAITLILGML